MVELRNILSFYILVAQPVQSVTKTALTKQKEEVFGHGIACENQVCVTIKTENIEKSKMQESNKQNLLSSQKTTNFQRPFILS